jgi:hypothetical protein
MVFFLTFFHIYQEEVNYILTANTCPTTGTGTVCKPLKFLNEISWSTGLSSSCSRSVRKILHRTVAIRPHALSTYIGMTQADRGAIPVPVTKHKFDNGI